MVWTTTIGAVLGPNLVGPGEVLGAAAGMPALTGAYLFTIVGQVAGIALYLVALRPTRCCWPSAPSRHTSAAPSESRADRRGSPDTPRSQSSVRTG